MGCLRWISENYTTQLCVPHFLLDSPRLAYKSYYCFPGGLSCISLGLRDPICRLNWMLGKGSIIACLALHCLHWLGWSGVGCTWQICHRSLGLLRGCKYLIPTTGCTKKTLHFIFAYNFWKRSPICFWETSLESWISFLSHPKYITLLYLYQNKSYGASNLKLLNRSEGGGSENLEFRFFSADEVKGLGQHRQMRNVSSFVRSYTNFVTGLQVLFLNRFWPVRAHWICPRM